VFLVDRVEDGDQGIDQACGWGEENYGLGNGLEEAEGAFQTG